MKSQFDAILEQYPTFNEKEVQLNIAELLKQKSAGNQTAAVYKTILSLIDLTSLNTNDTEEGIQAFTTKVNDFEEAYPELENVAAICVYPSMVKTVREVLTVGVDIAAVTGGFPHSQTFMEVKIAETSLAVLDGASEIDIVFPVGKLLEEKYDDIVDEIREIKSACREARLKVILESGLLSMKQLRIASILAMTAGADFIKTSTGKLQPAATLEAAWCMCKMIAEYNRINDRKVGFKAAGGIRTTEEAVNYYCVVESLLGKEWLNKELFRFGASSLANNVLSDITGEKVKFF
ncbi:MAG: deoxyribose-phosphate aldolase [Bacteroidota bacterium]|nr:deoxyribose-phosphate aldolase [Bacteroidota bacterium]